MPKRRKGSKTKKSTKSGKTGDRSPSSSVRNDILSEGNIRPYFTCHVCGAHKNIDESYDVSKKVCVACFEKEQIHERVSRKIECYLLHLKRKNQLTKIRRKKIKDIIRLSEMLLPQEIFEFSKEELIQSILDSQLIALKLGIESIKEKYGFTVINTYEIKHSMLETLTPLWNYKKPSRSELEKRLIILDPVCDIKKIFNSDIHKFFSDLRKAAVVPYFTKIKNKFEIRQFSPFSFNVKLMEQVLNKYLPEIEKYSSQIERFRDFVETIASESQFQTLNDMMLNSIKKYVKTHYSKLLKEFSAFLLEDIGKNEPTNLPILPNISLYLLHHHESVFYRWFTDILPFEKIRLGVDSPKAMGRTDFVIRLTYQYNPTELRIITNALKKSAPDLLRAKFEKKITRVKKNTSLSESEKETKIKELKKELETQLLPQNIKKFEEDLSKKVDNTAKFLILYSEKAFNMVLDSIIKVHYRRLKLRQPVRYITNIDGSDVKKEHRNLIVRYTFASREW